MKYIKTTEGVYEIKDGLNQTPKEIQIALISGDYIQANTIEKLCDGFYIDDGTHNFLQEFIYEKWQYDGFTNALKEYNNLGKDYTGYGFIKTSKGLIYVAKLNDKGVLELI